MAAMGLLLIVWGLFKKAVVASELSVGLVDPVFFDPSTHSSLDLIAAAYGYAVQIYCDFSAYSDMAIGLAALLGYRFPHNFNQPYRARSLQDFWRRWHISLSSWLRDYLYISLGGSRGGLARQCRNLMITMLLGGLWHGAKWTFLIWGGLHGLVQVIETLWRKRRPRAAGAAATAGDPRHLPHRDARLDLLPRRQLRRRDRLSRRDRAGRLGEHDDDAAGAGADPVRHGDPLRPAPSDAGHRDPGAAGAGMARGAGARASTILLIDAMRFEGVAPFIYYQF